MWAGLINMGWINQYGFFKYSTFNTFCRKANIISSNIHSLESIVPSFLHSFQLFLYFLVFLTPSWQYCILMSSRSKELGFYPSGSWLRRPAMWPSRLAPHCDHIQGNSQGRRTSILSAHKSSIYSLYSCVPIYRYNIHYLLCNNCIRRIPTGFKGLNIIRVW